jgi:hypothetical protein
MWGQMVPILGDVKDFLAGGDEPVDMFVLDNL